MEHTYRDNWVSNPTVSRSSLSRTHSSLFHRPELLRQNTQYSKYSPRAKNSELHSNDKDDDSHDTKSSDTMIDISDDHITPDWYHLALIRMESKQDSVAQKMPKLSRQTSVAEIEIEKTCSMIDTACKLRKKWLYANIKQHGHIGSLVHDKDISLDVDRMRHILPKSLQTKYSFEFIDGVTRIYTQESEIFELYSFDEYIEDLHFIYKLMAFGPAKTLCYKRLKILQCRFKLHLLLNNEVEATESHSVPYRDFYNVRKIDNHIHHSACMHQKHLLRFIKDKYKTEPNKIVNKENKTLKQVFDELHINIQQLSVDKLDVHAQQSTFQRFDKFNAKYNPMGQRPLRTLFLKIDNEINGEFLAGITKEVFADLQYQKYQFCEYRLSIYGKKRSEWDIVSDWICNNNLHCSQVRWLIQIPRIYPVFKKSNLLTCFDDMLSNIFSPLFEVTINPSSHPSLHLFLSLVVGFDSVDDESIPESMANSKCPTPANYNMDSNPPYIYYMYYMWVNIYKLNKLREERGFNTFALRPHSGEAGSLNHLASAFLVAQSINHGIRLRYSPILQYLYYLEQIGLSVSPLSNNILFEEYDRNPFPLFFERGLNVTLSSDDPLLIHYTKDALLEEYSIAAQVYNLSSIDLSEIARNSVLQSGWDEASKQEWIGLNYKDKDGAAANDIYRTNVPNSRLQFRCLLLKEERTFIKSRGKKVLSKSRFFSQARISQSVDILSGTDSDDAYDDEIQSQNKKVPTDLPRLLPMQSRKSWDTDEEKEEVEEIEEEKEQKIINNIDGLLEMIDSLYVNIDIDIKDLDFKDKHNKLLYKPQYNYKNGKHLYVQTPFGKGYILSESNLYCTVNMDNMIASVLKTRCKVIHNKEEHDNDLALSLRDICDSDLERVYELEVRSYPLDEVVSREKLFYRFIFARKYFKVLTLNGSVIGFICGTKAKQSVLTDETMSVHDRKGKHLCIYSVVVDDKYRRNGFGTKMMKLYVKEEIGSNYNSSLLSIRLCCKKHLISFYGDCGFKLVGESDLDHGKDKWYEMAIEIIHDSKLKTVFDPQN